MTHTHHEIESSLSFNEKMIKLLNHWIKHNQDHADTYLEWAQKAESHHLTQVTENLKKIQLLTQEIHHNLIDAKKSVKGE
jgi:hypothetical protein